MAETIDVDDVIERGRFGGMQLQLLLLCGVLLIFDGFDAQSIGFVAPALLQEWGASRSALGPVFSAGLAGLMLGAFVTGPIADRYGRKPVLVGCALSFGILTLACAAAPSLPWLIIGRLLAGIGLGGAMPNAIALVTESVPARMRSRLATIVVCGYSLGGALGGLVTNLLLPSFGWRAVFIAGGAAPLILLPFLIFGLQDSVQFLVVHRPGSVALRRALARLVPDVALPAEVALTTRQTVHKRSSPLLLFSDRLGKVTTCLWIGFFMNLIILYLLTNYLPTVLQAGGLAPETANQATAVYQVGGIVGALCLGWLIDRLNASYVLGLALALASGFALLTVAAGSSALIAFAGAFGAGFCIIGGQIGANAYAALLYPPFMRATGVGWALGMGRFGSIFGPMLVSALLTRGFALDTVFNMTTCFPALLAGLFLFLAGQMRRGAVNNEVAVLASGPLH